MVGLIPASATRAELVGQWKFDEGSGTTAYDSSGNGHDGTLVGGATWADGRFGGGIELDGTSGYVEVPSFERGSTVGRGPTGPRSYHPAW
jgi:hypothetical protein